MRATIVVLQTRHPAFARASFLTNSEEVVKRFLENSFIFEGVRWDRIHSLLEIGKHPKLHSLLDQSGGTWEDFFSQHFKYTLVPFDVLPSPLGFRYSKTDIQRIARADINSRYNPSTGGHTHTWGPSPGAILLDRLSTVRLKLRGEVYLSPCEACKNLFAHLAGNCELLAVSPSHGGPRTRVSLCHMPLFERSDALPEDSNVASSPAPGPVSID